MSKERYYEIFFTTDYVSENSWLKFLNCISRLNGLFRAWRIYVKFENNKVRYFIKCNKDVPTTLSDLGDFLIKKIDDFKSNIRVGIKIPYFITNTQRSIIDIFDRNESKKNRILEEAVMKIYPYKNNNFIFFTKLCFIKDNKRIYRSAFFNIPHYFFSIDFSKHTRFFHKRDIKKYLKIEKTVKIFEKDNKNGILQIDTFPYFQENYYLNLDNYDFDKHSMVIGGSGTGKSKLLSLLVQNISNNEGYNFKYKIVVIDPHNSLQNEIGGLNNSKIIDFNSKSTSIDLFKSDKKNIISETENLLEIFKNIMSNEYNSKLERVLRHSIFLLIYIQKMNLNNLRNLIIDSEFRNNILKEYKKDLSEPVLNFFLNDFNELKNKSHR